MGGPAKRDSEEATTRSNMAPKAAARYQSLPSHARRIRRQLGSPDEDRENREALHCPPLVVGSAFQLFKRTFHTPPRRSHTVTNLKRTMIGGPPAGCTTIVLGPHSTARSPLALRCTGKSGRGGALSAGGVFRIAGA